MSNPPPTFRATCTHAGSPIVLAPGGGIACSRCDSPIELVPDGSQLYGSRAPLQPPPGRSRDWLRRHGRELLAFGATRTGGVSGKGVTWTIAAADFARWEASRRPAPITRSSPTPDDDAIASRALESVSFRPTTLLASIAKRRLDAHRAAKRSA